MTSNGQYPAVNVGARAAGAQAAPSWQLQRPLPPRRLLQSPHKDSVGQPIPIDHQGGTSPPLQPSQPQRLPQQLQPAVHHPQQAGFAVSPSEAATHCSQATHCSSLPVQSLIQQPQQQRQETELQHAKFPDLPQMTSGEPSREHKALPHGQSHPRPPPLMAAAACAFASQAEDSSGMGHQESDSARSTSLPSSSGSQGVPAHLPEQPPRVTPERPSSESSASKVTRDISQLLLSEAQLMQENEYLKQNLEYMRNHKHQMAHKIQAFEGRVRTVEMQREHYKTLYEESQRNNLVFMQQGPTTPGGGSSASTNGHEQLEIMGIQQQLSAIQLLKDALNAENLELQERIKVLERSKHSQASCVICMDNLANVVCMPCKHLAMCSFCSQHTCTECNSCPICRGVISDRMLIYMP